MDDEADNCPRVRRGRSDAWGLERLHGPTDSHGVVYVFAEMFENPTLIGLPTHGFHVMFKSTDGGQRFKDADRQAGDGSMLLYGSRIRPMRTRRVCRRPHGSLRRAERGHCQRSSHGVGATNEIVDAWSDSDDDVNAVTTELQWSTDGGTSWSDAAIVSLGSDRPLYLGTTNLANGRSDVCHLRGRHSAMARERHDFAASVSRRLLDRPGGRQRVLRVHGRDYNGSTDTSAGHHDLRGNDPDHDIYQERVGDYVYAAASDVRCRRLDGRTERERLRSRPGRPGSIARGRGTRAAGAVAPRGLPGTFGNTDIWSSTTG